MPASPQKNKDDNYVLDTFALQAFLASEPGADEVERLLRVAGSGEILLYVSWISLAEVYYITYRNSLSKDREVHAKATIEGLSRLAVRIEPAGKVESLKAAHIKAKFPLSLADAFVAALGQIYDARIVTGDPEFKPLEEAGEIRVLWLPEKPKTGTRSAQRT